MRNLLNFLARYNSLIIFLLLEVLALYLVATSNNYHNTRLVKGVRSVTSGIESRIENTRNYLKLRQINQGLAEENTLLQSLVEKNKMVPPPPFALLSDTVLKTQYEFSGAKIVNNSVNRQKNFFTINRGYKQGAGPDMAVICNNGVAGLIVSSTENYSVAMSVLNIDFRLSCRLKSNGYFGSLTWNGVSENYATLSEIPQHVSIGVGDTVETTSYSAIFPEGILVGTVTGFEKSGGDFFRVSVKLSTDFRNLNHVTVIRNLRREEQVQAEKSYQ